MVDRLSISSNPITNLAFAGKKILSQATPTAKELDIDLNNNASIDTLEWCAFASVANTDGSASISAAEESALWARLSTDPTTVKQELNTASSKMFGNLQACYDQVTGQSLENHSFLAYLMGPAAQFKKGQQSLSLDDFKQNLIPPKTTSTPLFFALDTNGNDIVESTEVEAFKPQAATMLIFMSNLSATVDTDNNKYVSTQEVNAFFSDTNKAAAAINATKKPNPLFQELDTNGDGSVTDKDYNALRKKKSSSLSESQKSFIENWKNAKNNFANQDLDNDKKIDFKEAVANHLALFEHAKSNGSLQPTDLQSLIKLGKTAKEIREIATRWLLGSEAKVKPVASGLSEKMKQFLPLLMMMGQNNNPMMSMFMMMMDED